MIVACNKLVRDSCCKLQFNALSNIQDMISEELHESKDWEQWTKEEFDFLVAAVKALLHEIYVAPEDRKKLLQRILALGPDKKASEEVDAQTKPNL